MNLFNLFNTSVIWNTAYEATPAGSANPAQGDDRIREAKEATRERFAHEHHMDLASGTVAEDGWHLGGSAVSYYQSAAPTLRPDGVTALTADDNGRLWVDSDTGEMYVYISGTGWTLISVATAMSIHNLADASHPTVAPHAIVRLTSGSGNWTVPANVTRIKVTPIGGGGGGGGGGSGGGGGGTGGSTTFTGATTGVGGGGGGAAGSGGGYGGLGPTGGAGSAGTCASNDGTEGRGGSGGGAGGRGFYGAAGSAGNYGGGGGGGYGYNYGGGGGGGTNISSVLGDILATTPGATIAYSVGAGGTAGTAGASGYAGGTGGSGIIIIEY